MLSYKETLRKAAHIHHSILCLGIDPLIDYLPSELRKYNDERDILQVGTLVQSMIKICKTHNVIPSTFKINIGYFSRYDTPYQGVFRGSETMAEVITQLRTHLDDIPIIVDAKRGDIAISSENYVHEILNVWNADAVTISPYMGIDSMRPFLDYADMHNKGVYILVRTSNPGSAVIQDITLAEHTQKLYHRVASVVHELSQSYQSLGIVLGSRNIDELSSILSIFDGVDVPILIPGVGAQGGNAEEIRSIIHTHNIDMSLVSINVSRAGLFPWWNAHTQENTTYDANNAHIWQQALERAITTLHTHIGGPQ